MYFFSNQINASFAFCSSGSFTFSKPSLCACAEVPSAKLQMSTLLKVRKRSFMKMFKSKGTIAEP